MELKIYKYGEKVLREKSAPVAVVTDELRAIVGQMVDTMHDSRGVGLAAPQVGISQRFCVIDVPSDCDDEEDAAFNAPIEQPLVMFNPEIVSRNGSVCDKEGCLSLPGIGGKSIVRAHEVTCQYLDVENRPQMITCRGYLARAVQHEIDHLDGVLYIDRMNAVERLEYAAKLKKLAKSHGGVR